MTFAPQSLKDLVSYIEAHGIVNLGVIGDPAHTTKGVSYHLGKDQLLSTAYSIKTARDKAGLSNAASAIDLGKFNGSFTGLRKFSSWLAAECMKGASDTNDIREVIFSPDGITVYGWSDLAPASLIKDYGDSSHKGHSHISFYRDSEFRSKLAVFKRYFEEADVDFTITEINAEDWKPTGGIRRPIRSTPDRQAGVIVGYIEVGEIIRTVIEGKSSDGNIWRVTERTQDPGFLLRSDFDAVVQGGDPALHAQFDAFMARTPVPVVDCQPAINEAVAPLNTQITNQAGIISGLQEELVTAQAAAASAAGIERERLALAEADRIRHT